MEKTLTVVIPTYNMERYLRRCLDSLILPPDLMSNLEVLVINDGSKDHSSEIAHEYEHKYPSTFRVIDKENGNYGSCVNIGLKEAKGKYIKILDADDYYETEALNVYLDTLVRLDVDLVLNDMVYVNEAGERGKPIHLPLPKLKSFDMLSMRYYPSMHCVAYKTENLRKINYHQAEGISYTDQQWVFEPMSTVSSAFYIPIVLYMYLVGREGQTMNLDIRRKSLSQVIKVAEDMIDVYCLKQYPGKSGRWLKGKLMEKISAIYYETIVYLRDDKNPLMFDFDRKIESQYPALYKDLSTELILSKKYPINYGKRWKKNHSLNYNNPMIWLYYFLKKVKAILAPHHER